MQDNIDFFEPDELEPDYPELQGLAQSLLSESDIAPNLMVVDQGEWTPRAAVSLDLSELLSGDSGEIVLGNDVQLSLTTSSEVKDAGFVDHHITADGEDVSGYAFMSLDSGVTVFYPTGSDLMLDAIVS